MIVFDYYGGPKYRGIVDGFSDDGVVVARRGLFWQTEKLEKRAYVQKVTREDIEEKPQ